MTTAVQHRRGTTAEHSTFTGLEGEVTIDTTKDTAVIHDGALAGGYPLAKENLANADPTSLGSLTGASTAADDQFLVYDTSIGNMKKISRAELNNAMVIDALDTVDINGGTIDGTAIGATTASTGAFTTLSASSSVTLSGATANGVAYANGSKVLTTGSALTFDGTNLGITGSNNGLLTTTITNSNTGASARADIIVASDSADIRMIATSGAYTGVSGWADTGVISTSSSTSGGMLFNVQQASPVYRFMSSATNELMRLTSTGLGIGTSNPSGKLDVVGDIKSSGEFVINSGTTAKWTIGQTSDNLYFYSVGAGSERMRINSNGNVGIGTSSTTNGRLNIDYTSGNTAIYISRNVSGTSYALSKLYNSGSDFLIGGTANVVLNCDYDSNSTGVDRNIIFQNRGSETARIDSSGNVGIGTSSPDASFKMTISGNSGGVTPGIYFDDQAASPKDYVLYTNGSKNFVLRNQTDAFDIWTATPSGNLGLGVTPSAWNSDYKNFAIGTGGELYGRVSTTEVGIGSNYYRNSAGNFIYLTSAAASYQAQVGGVHYWLTAASGTAGNAISFTQAMTLDASGNLGVGTTSPTNRLHVAGASTTQLQVQMSGQADMRIISDTGYGALSLESNMPLIFRTAATERARITSGGDLLVGTTTNYSGVITAYGNSDGANNPMVVVQAAAGSTSRTSIQFYRVSAGASVGSVTTTNTATAYNTSSDYRLKENIVPMNGALATVAQLNPVTYNWKADGSTGQGFIAHELQAVVPDCVTGEKDAVDTEGNPQYQGVDTSFLVATLVAAIKELKAEFDAYKLTHP